MVCPCINNFSRRHARDGLMKPILNHGIELVCRRRGLVVVIAAFHVDVNVNNLSDTALAGTDGAYFLKEFSKIVFTEDGGTLLESFVTKGKSFSDILF